jgi:hypothetical protein
MRERALRVGGRRMMGCRRERARTVAVRLALFVAGVLPVSGCDENPSPFGAPATYSATIEVTNDTGLLGSVAVDVAYRGFDGEFLFDDDAPRCEILVSGAFGVLGRRSADAVSIAVSAFGGMATPTPLVRCRLRVGSAATRDQFSITLRDALDTEGNPPTVAPVIEVTEVTEESGSSTTTTADHATSTSTIAD